MCGVVFWVFFVLFYCFEGLFFGFGARSSALGASVLGLVCFAFGVHRVLGYGVDVDVYFA